VKPNQITKASLGESNRVEWRVGDKSSYYEYQSILKGSQAY